MNAMAIGTLPMHSHLAIKLDAKSVWGSQRERESRCDPMTGLQI